MTVDDLPPLALRGYRLERRLAVGGMGVVYKAYPTGGDSAVGEGEPVAIKVIRDDLAQSSDYRERFVQEAERAHRVRHENVVKVLDFAESDGRLFLVMPYIDGDTLQHLVGIRPWNPRTAAAVIGPIADALDAVHKTGLLHGDLSPRNIILAGTPENPRPMLTDFGLARPLTTAGLSGSDSWGHSGEARGTPGFMSPETSRGDSLTRHSDIYSLCAVLYYLLCGEPPLPGVVSAQLRRKVPRDLERVIARGLSSTPDERYDTAEEFARALRDAVQHHRSHPLLILAGAVCVLLAVLGGVLYANPKLLSSSPTASDGTSSPASPPPTPASAPPVTAATAQPTTPSPSATSPLASPTRQQPPSASPTPSPSTSAPLAPPPVERVVCAEDLLLRDADNNPTGSKLFRGDMVTAHGRSADGWLTEVTVWDGRKGWVESRWLAPSLEACPD